MIPGVDLLKEPSQHDIAWQWAQTILPSDMSTPYGAALGVFAATMAFLGSLFISYHVIVGIVSSAYSGKVLGERFHQIWAPLRVLVGFGLLVPLAAGFSAAHYGLRDIVVKPSIVLGNASWVMFVDQVANKRVPIIAPTIGGTSLAIDIMEHEVCLAVERAIPNAWGYPPQLPNPGGRTISSGWFGTGAPDRVQWDYGQNCGNFSFSLQGEREGFGAARRLAVAEIITDIRNAAALYGEYFAVHARTLSPEQAIKAIQGGRLPYDLPVMIREWGKRYDTHIQTAAQNAVTPLEEETRSKLVEAARQQGFVNAGAYWRGLGQVSERTTSLTNESAERVSVRYDEGNTGSLNIQAALQTLRYHIAGEEAQIGLSANDLASAGDESTGLLTKMFASMTRWLGEMFATRGETESAVARMISDGHAMMNVSGGVVVGSGAAIMAAYTAPGKVIGADGLASWFLDWGKIPVAILWILGAIRAYVFPFLPFLFVFVGAFRWLVAILEASIALICWAFIWIRMDGQDLVDQQQRTGAMLLFNIFLRPVLIVLTLCASYLIFEPVLATLDELWPTAMYGQTGGYVTGLGAMIASLVLKTFVLWAVCINLFGLIQEMADRIGEWFGIPAAGKFNDKADATALAVGAASVMHRGSNVGNVGRGLSTALNDKSKSGGNGGPGDGIAIKN